MSDKELAEAAERWGKFCRGIDAIPVDLSTEEAAQYWLERIREHWDHYPGGRDRADEDKTVLSSAYLARLDSDAAREAERALPIDLEWLRSLGSVPVPDEVWPNSRGNDNEQIGERLAVFEFNDSGEWLVRDADWMSLQTRGQLLDLLAALGIKEAAK